jgi:hypothetical protein
MSSRTEFRFTIAQFLVFIMVFGLLLTAVTNRHAVILIAQLLSAITLLAIVVAAIMGVSEGYLGRLCPSCGQGRMQRVALSTFGYRFFKCDHCRARWKRGWSGIWLPVESEADLARYARKTDEDPWTLPPGMAEEEKVVWSKTHTRLLRNKQLRNPNAPRQEKLPPVE